MPYAHITGWGMAVPQKVLTNFDLEKMVETSDAWIRERTGIRERRIAGPDEHPSVLGARAALQALEVARLHPKDVELIICATSSPEHLFPATACLIQDAIGASKAGAFDLLAACSGFIYAVQMAAQAIRSGAIQNALVIGAETLSRITNWKERNTCILFGDGAGAFVLQASERPGGVLAAVMHSDGSGGDLLIIPAGGSRMPASLETVSNGYHYIHMDGREVFRFATRVLTQSTWEVLEKANLKLEDIRWIIPHQANYRIIEAAARSLKLPIERFIINLDRYGNTSTASVPIATCEAAEKGLLKAGDKIVFNGFGAGLTWGAMVVEWTGPLPSATRPIRPQRYRPVARLRSWWHRFLRLLEGLIWGRRA
ncbi:MAG: beta-ketoacyl-ACP synthase III [Anaerolineales bacterium]